MHLFDLFFYIYIDMVEPPIISKSDPEVYSVDVAEYFVPKKKYKDREEMINWTCYQTRNA